MVLHRSLYLVVLHFVLCVHCYILHPNYSYDQTSKPDRNVNLPAIMVDPMRSLGWSLDEERGLVRGLSEKRMERHVDAIFTNTYRKFLGQISARQYLQNMMGKRLGQADTRGQYPSASGRSDRSIRVLMNLKNPTWRAVQPRL
ncbi:somatoliberin isoform X2 [Pseudophryne corroboree]|uniref:somatoliberin isoform X2 n=1 Tax=Pseudophryne corroboree TaxID=495146 RepID=UPI003081B84E